MMWLKWSILKDSIELQADRNSRVIFIIESHYEKTCFFIRENRDVDQLLGDCTADQCLCYRLHRFYNPSNS